MGKKIDTRGFWRGEGKEELNNIRGRRMEVEG